MTVTSCVAGCKGVGSRYAALLEGKLCECGNVITGSKTGDELCDSTCKGPANGSQWKKCGGKLKYSLYRDHSFRDKWNKDDASRGYVEGGCYVDDNVRIVRGSSYTQPDMTIDKCHGLCAKDGYPYAMTENGNQCIPTTVKPTPAPEPDVEYETITTTITEESIVTKTSKNGKKGKQVITETITRVATVTRRIDAEPTGKRRKNDKGDDNDDDNDNDDKDKEKGSGMKKQPPKKNSPSKVFITATVTKKVVNEVTKPAKDEDDGDDDDNKKNDKDQDSDGPGGYM
ncbi:hypothetical protein ABW21_db0206376 [Orbilia brochopaga]|nr:hypothetical protein ABW21_db0206376 [Drechslerella brochopaga]